MPDSPAVTQQARWAFPAAIAVVGVAAFGVGYGLRQQSIVSQMTARQYEKQRAGGANGAQRQPVAINRSTFTRW